MKIDNSSIYTQNLAGLNSAKATKESEQSFDTVLENETKTSGIKAEDIKNGSDLDEYLMFKYIGELGHERGTGVWFLSMVSAIQVAIDKYGSGDNDVWPSIEKSRENYKSTDDLKQDIINRISIIQSDRYDYTPPNKSKAEHEMQKQDTINALTQIYKELFNEEPTVPKFSEFNTKESSIDISAAIKEFLSKPYEKEEDVLKFIKDLDKQNQEEPSVEILGIKERIYKQNEKLKSENLNLLLQNI
ncbi:hypothetical protein [uncultured Campylobacter sp.]|uniref:hypothetical protein n=1 Tax=uncultured Campylobacter sp. TaxID=218934 RepID=UPI00262AC9E5|nr:hypothetical protein [uncultured Campylobacter sp.]